MMEAENDGQFTAYLVLSIIWIIITFVTTIVIFSKPKLKLRIHRNSYAFARIFLISITGILWLIAQALYEKSINSTACSLFQWSFFFGIYLVHSNRVGYPLTFIVSYCPAFVAIICDFFVPDVWSRIIQSNTASSLDNSADEMIDIMVLTPIKAERKDSLSENAFSLQEQSLINKAWYFPVFFGVVISFFLLLVNLTFNLLLPVDLPIQSDMECMAALSNRAAPLIASLVFIVLALSIVIIVKLMHISKKFLVDYKRKHNYSEEQEKSMFNTTLKEQENELLWIISTTVLFSFLGMVYSALPLEILSFFSPFWFVLMFPMSCALFKIIYRRPIIPRFSFDFLKVPVIAAPADTVGDLIEELPQKKVIISGLKPSEANMSLVMKDQALRNQLKKFSIIEHCMENVLFLDDYLDLEAKYESFLSAVDVEDEISLKHNILEAANEMAANYILEDAALELNLQYNTKKEVIMAVDSGDCGDIMMAFESVNIEIRHIILTDVFPRFLRWIAQEN